MAITVEEYQSKTKENIEYWERVATTIEQEIDKCILKAIETNLITDKLNPNFVVRYKFSDKIPTPIKDMLRIKYGEAGWTIKENVDFKDANIWGYFDFYMKKV